MEQHCPKRFVFNEIKQIEGKSMAKCSCGGGGGCGATRKEGKTRNIKRNQAKKEKSYEKMSQTYGLFVFEDIFGQSISNDSIRTVNGSVSSRL